MEKISPSSELYSHPNILLEDHLIGVARFSEFFLSEKPPELREAIGRLLRVISLTHDIGKATKFFQDYLFAEEKRRETLRAKRETSHSLFSSICAYWITKNLCQSNELFPVFSFLTVRRHHGDLRDIRDEVLFDEKDVELLRIQLESIDSEKFSILCSKLYGAGLPLMLNKQIIEEWIDRFPKESRKMKKIIRGLDENLSNYIIFNLIYSILLDSDKSEVTLKDREFLRSRNLYFSDWVENYKRQNVFPDASINPLRDKAYVEALSHPIELMEKIYSLNLPTGLGKTLISLSFAFKLRDAIKSETTVEPRIIYSLPFLSIIDQNAEIIKAVIEAKGVEPDTDILLKHHHLADIFYKRVDEEFETDEAKILVEGWNSLIIVTTFVQLFHTLISNRNRSIRKFHRLTNSIIILDEVQSIPIKYWSLLRCLLLELSRLLNTYIILVTATEPLIFERGETKRLINRESYFKALDRVSLRVMLESPMNLKQLIAHFDLKDNRSYLFIFNTISAAKEFYYLIKDRVNSVTYLSTHITPKERFERISEIKKGKYRVVVSTQLVEAGVDIDFEVVVRDIAPLDSINQSAGRCNRGGSSKGEIFIVKLVDSSGRKYSSYIYDPVLIDITERILLAKSEYKESEFLELIDKYYRETKEKKSQEHSKKMLEALMKLRYDSEDDRVSVADFKLIEEEYPEIDVFVELDEEAREVWRHYLSLKEITNLFEKRKAFDSLKGKFYQYVITIPKYIENKPPLIGELGYVTKEFLKDYYDHETGYKTKESKTLLIW